MPTDIEPEHITSLDDIRLSLISVYDKSPVIIWFSDKTETKILTENMDLAGDLIHSISNFLNIENLKVKGKIDSELFDSKRKTNPIYIAKIPFILDNCLFSQCYKSPQSILRTN